MNFFPHFFDFQQLNRENSFYSLQFGLPSSSFVQNQPYYNEFQYASPLWTGNPNFFKTFQNTIDLQYPKQTDWKIFSTSNHEDPSNNQEFKNISNRQRKQKKVFKQKQSRNIISNLFRQALRCLLIEKDKTIQMITKISEKQKIEINAKEFLQNISKKLKNLKNYVRLGQIEIFLKGKESGKSKQHAKVLRILVHKFLREEIIPCLCNNPKIQNHNRMIHISECRKFLEFISL